MALTLLTGRTLLHEMGKEKKRESEKWQYRVSDHDSPFSHLLFE